MGRPQFIKVRKDNQSHDRGFIAVDAICSVFENKDAHNVSIMTMDGFWYDVDDDVEKLYCLIIGEDSENKTTPLSNTKKAYYRRKKMMPPLVANEKSQQNHEKFKATVEEKDIAPAQDEEYDVFKGAMCGKKANRQHLTEKNLPASAGEGQYDLNPKVEPPPASEGL